MEHSLIPLSSQNFVDRTESVMSEHLHFIRDPMTKWNAFWYIKNALKKSKEEDTTEEILERFLLIYLSTSNPQTIKRVFPLEALFIVLVLCFYGLCLFGYLVYF